MDDVFFHDLSIKIEKPSILGSCEYLLGLVSIPQNNRFGGTSRTSSRRIKRGLPHSPRTIAAGALKAAVGIARLNLQGAGNAERLQLTASVR